MVQDYPPREGMVPTTVDWALLYQVEIKTIVRRHDHRPVDLGNSSVGSFLSDESGLCQVRAKQGIWILCPHVELLVCLHLLFICKRKLWWSPFWRVVWSVTCSKDRCNSVSNSASLMLVGSTLHGKNTVAQKEGVGTLDIVAKVRENHDRRKKAWISWKIMREGLGR